MKKIVVILFTLVCCYNSDSAQIDINLYKADPMRNLHLNRTHFNLSVYNGMDYIEQKFAQHYIIVNGTEIYGLRPNQGGSSLIVKLLYRQNILYDFSYLGNLQIQLRDISLRGNMIEQYIVQFISRSLYEWLNRIGINARGQVFRSGALMRYPRFVKSETNVDLNILFTNRQYEQSSKDVFITTSDKIWKYPSANLENIPLHENLLLRINHNVGHVLGLEHHLYSAIEKKSIMDRKLSVVSPTKQDIQAMMFCILLNYDEYARTRPSFPRISKRYLPTIYNNFEDALSNIAVKNKNEEKVEVIDKKVTFNNNTKIDLNSYIFNILDLREKINSILKELNYIELQ